jgi:hypothetical protein
MRGISWLAEKLLAFHGGLCCVGYILGSKREDERFFAEWWLAFPETFPIQFFCQPHTPQLLFVLGSKEVGGLLVIILQF